MINRWKTNQLRRKYGPAVKQKNSVYRSWNNSDLKQLFNENNLDTVIKLGRLQRLGNLHRMEKESTMESIGHLGGV